ncbi:MAG: hypothetical protein WBQ14_10025 [Gaiellaceae bacterium]
MSDTVLFERLDQLVDDCAGARGDWNDVLGRSGIAVVPPPPRRRFASRRALVFAAVLAFLLVILFATPAFGLLRDWIGRKDVRFNGKTAPFVIKKEFADMSLGQPKSWDPQVIASESRRVVVYKAFGKEYPLYVAPTRKGGFCWTIVGMGGSCASSRPRSYPGKPAGNVNSYLLGVMSGMQRVPGTRSQLHSELSGTLFAENAASLRVEYEDHSFVQVPFVYVSKPINAGFFFWGRPSGHRRVGTRPLAVSVRDSHGELIARVVVLQEARRPTKAPPGPTSVPPKYPRQPRVPTPPLQRARIDGVSFVAGRNGVVTIDASNASARVRALLDKGVFGSCFSFFAPYHQIDPVGMGMRLTTGHPRATLPSPGIPTPFDGCQVDGTYGDRWPDRFRSHSVVEVAFTPRAKTYFAESATAADLALFVRTRMRNNRRLSGKALDTAISHSFGTAITHLPSSSSSLPAGRIGYFDRAGGATFLEYSATGRRFYVTIAKGKIASENVRGLTYLN